MTPGRRDTAGLFVENFAAAHAVARRLTRSVRSVGHLFPISAAAVERLREDEVTALDAFLHRFNNLLSITQDQLFVGVARLEEEDTARRSRRDMADLMERLGIVESSDRFSDLARARNRLVHAYPTRPDRQAEILNEAYEAAPELLRILDRARDRVTRRGLVDLSRFEPLAPDMFPPSASPRPNPGPGSAG